MPGDRVLLASDGLTDLVPERDIEQILADHADDAAVEHLVDAALAAGGRDNVTCLLATVIDGPAVLGRRRPRRCGAGPPQHRRRRGGPDAAQCLSTSAPACENPPHE